MACIVAIFCKTYKFKKAFSLVELCLCVVLFGLIASAILRSTQASFSLLLTGLSSQEKQRLQSAIMVFDAYFQRRFKPSLYVGDSALYFMGIDEYAGLFYLPIASQSSDLINLKTKFELPKLKEAILHSSGLDFTQFEVAIVFYGVPYAIDDFGYFSRSNIAMASAIKDNEMTLFNASAISPAYAIVTSAYGLEFNEQNGELYLVHSFRPWLAGSLKKAKRTLLIDSIKSLSLERENGSLRLELCAKSGACLQRLLL